MSDGPRRLTVENPHYRGTEFFADVKLWEQADPLNLVVWSREKARLQATEDRSEIVQALIQHGLDGDPEEQLSRSISDAVKALREKSQAVYSKWANQDLAHLAVEMIEELTPGSRWINAPDGAYWMNGTNDRPVAIDSVEMQTLLWDRFKLNKAQRHAEYYTNALTYHTRLLGEKVDLHELAVFQPGDNRVLVDMGSGDVAILTGKKIDFDRNGAHGVLFRPMKFQEPFRYVPRHGFPLEELINSINFADSDSSPLTPDDQRWLYRFYIAALFFGSVMPQKPIAIAVGETESGKSTLFRLLGRILAGPEWELKVSDSEEAEDFWAAVTSNSIAAWDNVDRSRKWLQDALCTASDGVPISKRKKFTTNEEGLYKPRCFIQITSRTPNFRRKDVSTRGILFHMQRRTEKRPAYELFSEIQLNRDRYMSEILDTVNAALTVAPQDGTDSPIRNADFWAVCKRVAMGLKFDYEKLRGIFSRLKQAQDGFAAEENVIVLAADEWLGVEGNSGRQITGSKLFKELGEFAEKLGYKWYVPNAAQFGRELNELARDGGLDTYLKFENHGRKGGRGTLYTLRRLDDEGGQLL